MPQGELKANSGPDVVDKTRSLRQAIHDLRTPLNHILGYAEMAIEDIESDGGKDSVAILSSLCEGARSAALQLHHFSIHTSENCSPTDVMSFQAELQASSADLRSKLKGVQQISNVSEPVQQALRKICVAVDSFVSAAEVFPAPATPAATPEIPAQPPPATEHPPTKRETAPSEPVSAEAARPRANRVLVVEDDAGNREILVYHLCRQSYEVQCATNGAEGLAMLRQFPFDLVLLDQVMPVLDGIGVLREMRQDPKLQSLPVIMISGVDEVQIAISSIEEGVEDFIVKPFNPLILNARVKALLERKHLRDRELQRTAELESAFREIENQKRISERLLLNILPGTVAEELRSKGSVDPMYFEDVTVAITDFVGFTRIAETLSAEELVVTLHEYFTGFDRIVKRYGLEKLKTVGDSYIFVGGLPIRSPSHPVDSLLAALEMVAFVQQRAATDSLARWRMRIGIHTGPVIAGVVGVEKFAFDVWGDTINFCSRLEAASEPNRVNISEKTYTRVKDFFQCIPRGKVKTKDKTEADMYFVEGILPNLAAGNAMEVPEGFKRRYQVYFRSEPHAFPAAFPEREV